MKYEDVFEAIAQLELWALQGDGRCWCIVRELDGKVTVGVGVTDEESASTTVRDAHEPLVPVVIELIERVR